MSKYILWGTWFFLIALVGSQEIIGSPMARLGFSVSHRDGVPSIRPNTTTWPWLTQNVLSSGPNPQQSSPWQSHLGSTSSGRNVANPGPRPHIQLGQNRSARNSTSSGITLKCTNSKLFFAKWSYKQLFFYSCRESVHAIRSESTQQFFSSQSTPVPIDPSYSDASAGAISHPHHFCLLISLSLVSCCESALNSAYWLLYLEYLCSLHAAASLRVVTLWQWNSSGVNLSIRVSVILQSCASNSFRQLHGVGSY